MPPTLSGTFPAYADFAPRVPVHCVTPGLTGFIHRYYDSSPFSPSGRYMALTRLPFEDRLAKPGDVAGIFVVDLGSGESRRVADTRGWDVQLGAQLQWGADDHSLFFNDLEVGSWQPFGVRLDPHSGERKRLDGTVYSMSPDGCWTASPCLLRTAVTQRGYGVVVPRDRIPVNRGASTSDGIYLTSTETGASRLLVSIDRIVREAVPALSPTRFGQGDFFGFHVKWNPQGTRLMFVLRWLPRSWLPWKRKKSYGLKQVITMDADGGNIRVAVPADLWAKGGHHPNWCPDGDHIVMNLNSTGDGLRFTKLRYDGTSIEVLADPVRGSGHPTMHPNGRHVLSDAYTTEPVSFGDGTAPIRLIDLVTSTDTALVRIRTEPLAERARGALRVDPHPAWDRSYSCIAFNACPEGRRQVFVADLRDALAGP
jgi:hypothetical protein